MVDTIFSDVAQPDQARIVAINAQYFLKVGGHFVISIKVGIFVLHGKRITVTKKIPFVESGNARNVSNFLIVQANCIDSTAEAEVVFAGEVKKMQAEKMKPQEQVTLEPYERDHAVVVGIYRPPPKVKG